MEPWNTVYNFLVLWELSSRVAIPYLYATKWYCVLFNQIEEIVGSAVKNLKGAVDKQVEQLKEEMKRKAVSADVTIIIFSFITIFYYNSLIRLHLLWFIFHFSCGPLAGTFHLQICFRCSQQHQSKASYVQY